MAAQLQIVVSLLGLFQDQWLRVTADDASLVQAAFNLHGEPEKLPGWAEDAWLDDLILTAPTSTSSAEETTSSLKKAHSSGASKEGAWATHTLVYPAKKLVFCYIAKNACFNFNGLFNELNGKGNITGGGLFGASSLHNLGLSRADVSRKNGWKWAVFLRDPLIRYLSAWGSKCMQQEDPWNCQPDRQFSNHAPASAASVADFHKNVLANWQRTGKSHRAPRNEHWLPQQECCGGLMNTADYDFVGHLRGDVPKQVRSMLTMVGAPVHHVDHYFPRAGVHGHFSKLDPNLYYNDTQRKRMVSRMYLHDYDLPGLGKPFL